MQNKTKKLKINIEENRKCPVINFTKPSNCVHPEEKESVCVCVCVVVWDRMVKSVQEKKLTFFMIQQFVGKVIKYV